VQPSTSQDNIDVLIQQLSKLHSICVGNHPDIALLAGVIMRDLEQFRSEAYATPPTHYLARIAELEEEVLYLQEFNMSQRMMMEDIVKHLLELRGNTNG
jgi:hypothetical protein